ncbi:MAG TPA: ShlB/FhaC/HecB family hemolysin secretion/activation protein [Thiobacillus sp.]
MLGSLQEELSAKLDATLKKNVLIVALVAVVASPAIGAPPPQGGGAVLESVKSAPPARESQPRLEIEQPARPALQLPQGVKVKVTALNFTGNSVFPTSVLRAQVASSLGLELNFTELQALADRITDYYRKQGYPVARAYLPAQEIEHGEIEIAVIEGRYGKIHVNNQARLRGDAAAVLRGVKSGEVVYQPDLERGLLLLNDLAGIDVTATLRPGEETGTTDLDMQLRDGPKISGSIDADNFGSRYAGTYHGGLTLNLNNPFAIGDQISLRAVSSGESMWFGRLGYTAPIGDYGTKLGLAYSQLRYELGKDLSPLEIQGLARITSLSVQHPLVRSRGFNLYGQFGFDLKSIEESFLGIVTSRDELRVGSLAISGDKRLGQSALTNYGLTLSLGSIDKNVTPGPSRVNLDSNFSKLALDVSHAQRLTDAFGLGVRLAGQISSTALVGAEQFSVGGPNGVRAYRQGAALGDEGYVASFELRWNPRGPVHESLGGRQWGDLVQWSLFVEAGEASVHDSLPGQDRSRQLRGAGIGLNLGLKDNFIIKTSYAQPLGRDAPSSTAETTSTGRFWMQAVKWF